MNRFKRRIPIAVIIVLIFYVKDFVQDFDKAISILPQYFIYFIPTVLGCTLLLMALPFLGLRFFWIIGQLLTQNPFIDQDRYK